MPFFFLGTDDTGRTGGCKGRVTQGSLQCQGNEMARHIPGLETELRRARSKERPESQDGREKAQFYGDQAWSSPAGGETFTGGYRGFDPHVRIGGNMAGTKRHVQDFPEEYKPNV